MADKRPNILFIFSDQHNARCLSCADHPDVKTPHLDRLANEGTRFENAYTQNPICTPSRISFLSGLYPSTHGYYGLYGPEPVQPMTNLISWCKQHGYRTGALGKLHTPRYWIERDCQFVYDEFLEHPKYLEGAGLYEQNDNRDFGGGSPDQTVSPLPFEHSCEAVLAKQFARFVKNEGEPKDRGDSTAPWCAWVCFARPHQPYTPSEPFASMYSPESITLPPNQEGDLAKSLAERSNPPGPDELRKTVARYLALVSQVDHAIGMILELLEQRGELDNNIIVYSADHGDYAGEHGRNEKRGGIRTRAITRVPMIVRFPEQVMTDVVRDEIVEAVDVFPTLCELSGVPVPDSPQGMSFAHHLRGNDGPVRTSALTENAYRKALATKRWRYVANSFVTGEQDELFDIEHDPWETVNRIDDPDCQEVRQELQRNLLDRVVHARKPINSINGGWHEHKYDEDGRINLNACGQTDESPYW